MHFKVLDHTLKILFFSHLVKLIWIAQKFKLRSIPGVYSLVIIHENLYIINNFFSNCLRNWTIYTKMCHISHFQKAFHYREAEEARKTTYLSLMYTQKPEHKHIWAISLTPTVLLKQWLWTIMCVRSAGGTKGSQN